MADVRELRYDVKLTVNEFKERMREIGSLTSSLEDKIKRATEAARELGKGNGFDSLAVSAGKAGGILAKVGEEAEKLTGRFKGLGIGSEVEELTQNATSLRKILSELRKEKEILMRGGEVVPTGSGTTKSLETVLAQIKAVEDEIKRINALDLNKIIDKSQVTQFREYTAAIDTQRKAVEALDRSLARHKALAQSAYQQYGAEFGGANKVLERLGFNPAENPFGDWSKYVQGMAEAKAQVSKIHEHIAENRAVLKARQEAQAGNYTGNNEFARAWNRVRDDAEKWTVAISRGKQITDEELRSAQRVTAEYRKQVEVLAEGDRHVMANVPRSPVMDFGSAREFNRASQAAKEASAIAQNLSTHTTEVRSYEQEIRRLQARCEALYATYRKAPTQENLQAFARTRAALQATSREYARYQESINGASRTQSEFARKAVSHAQWITTGALIAAGAAVPTMAEMGLQDIDYRMAGIRQVIPSIEANPGLKAEAGEEYAAQLQKMNQAMTDFIGIAAKYGQNTDEVLESARSIGRMYGQGENGVVNTKLFTDQAAKMAVADAFSMEEATRGLEAAMSQWNLQTEDTNLLLTRSSEIIDIWTRAAHSGAASGQDISQAIQVAGAAAAQAGVSFSFFSSLVETGCRTTARSGNEVAQALKSLFVTMGSGKADKALAAWGIKTREIGEDGKEHVRSLEKQILDVSLAVSSTTKDTTKFLSTLSGGKYQYSKISAILKNYKEILRMQGVLNDGHTKGFADEQVKVQLDTIQRKMQQVKAEGMNLLADIGQNGGFETLKWMVTQFRDITTGFRKMNVAMKNGETNALSLAKGLAEILALLGAVRAVSAVIGKSVMLRETAKATWAQSKDYREGGRVNGLFGHFYADSREEGRARGAERAAALGMGRDTLVSEAEIEKRREHTAKIKEEALALEGNSAAHAENTASEKVNTASTEGNTVSKSANAAAVSANTASVNAESGAKVRETAAEAGNSAATAVNTGAKNVNAGAAAKQAVAENAGTGAVVRKSAAMRAGAVATGVFATAERVAVTATRTLNVALAAMGGPIGIAVTAAMMLVPYLLDSALAEGEMANAVKDATDALSKQVETAQQAYDQLQRKETAALQVAEAYNQVKESMAEAQEGSEEYKAKQEQLKGMEETLIAMLGEEAQQFVDSNGVKIEALKQYMAKEKEKQVQEQQDTLSTAKANADATRTQLESTKARIAGMKEEIKQVKATGTAWSWLNTVINSVDYKMAVKGMETANGLLSMANTYHEEGRGVSGWIDDWLVDNLGGVEEVKKLASDNYNQWAVKRKRVLERAKQGGNVGVLEQELAALESKKGDLEELLGQQDKVVAVAAQNLAEVQAEAAKSQTGAEPDDNTYGKGGRSEHKSGRKKKAVIDYSQDELSAAIHEAAQSDIARQYGFTEPLLRAIAARESGGDTTIRQRDENGNLLEDYAHSGHFGMFQVTRADAERFGTGDIAVPLNNAMTAVKLLAEKFDNTGSLWAAVKAYNGGSGDGYVNQVRANYQAQKESFDFSKGDDFGPAPSFNDEVIAGARAELGQPYGGSSWRDTMAKVCTTFVQKALINAGVDESTVDNLTAVATNWSERAAAAFHPFREVEAGAYVPKPGDIGLTNTDSNGKASHVVLIGENGEGYYAAAGSGRNSAYYGTNWQTAFASSGIEGVISVNELAGKPYTVSVRGGRKKPKSINDFQLDPYQEALYKEQRANEQADELLYRGKARDFLYGGSSGQDKAALAVAELKLASQQAAKEILDTALESAKRNIGSYLTSHKDIGEMLKKRGTSWEKLVPAERKALADLAGDDSFKKQVEAEEKIRQKIVQTTKAIEEQRQAWEKAAGYMNPDERTDYLVDRMDKDYALSHAYGDADPNGRRKVLAEEVAMLQEKLQRQQEAVREAKTEGDKERLAKSAAYEAEREKLNRLKAAIAGEATEEQTLRIKAQEEEVRRLQEEYRSLNTVGTKAEQDTRLEAEKTTKKLQEKERELHSVNLQLNNMILEGTVNMFSHVLAEGKSFKESFEDLWREIGNFALQQLLRIQLKAMFVRWGLKFADGGDIPGAATGGRIPGYASGGKTAGAITGAGTGTSDSILAYIANKDRFVYLSNGEYVMTAEATRRIGKENLDRMNYGRYAAGGAIAPTPYVPHISASVTRKAQVLNRENPNAKLESLMAQQTDLLRNMGKEDSGGGMVVLNTQASSEQVLKALAENPRALNAILGRNQRMGFR